VAGALALVVLAAACEAVPGDFTGDRKADLVHLAYDHADAADPYFTYDGDGKTDIAVFRPTNQTFHYLSSKTGKRVSVAIKVPAGSPALVPVPADYDKVGYAEAAETDLAGHSWYVAGHTAPVATFAAVGQSEYLPAPADYDGDGRTDPAVMDNDNADLWLAGQPQPPMTVQDAGPDFPTVLPDAVLVNYIRLTIYADCLVDPTRSPAGTC
jgi:hypothetical protein